MKKKLFLLIPTAVIALGLVVFSSAGQIRQFVSGGAASTETEAVVGFTCRETEPSDEEVRRMVDEVVLQTLGKEGFAALCSPGDRVVIKVNLVGPHRGRTDEQGRAIITDPRVVQYVAEQVREVIGWEEPADIIVTDALFYKFQNPSLALSRTSFHYARLERTGNGKPDEGDICYDRNGDGILDGGSGARLVNADAWAMDQRFLTVVEEPTLGSVPVYLPDFLRTKEQASGELPYCDVLIGLPLLKSHGFAGVTGALKLSYGFRYFWYSREETGREQHSGYGWGTGNKQLLLDYLCAQQKARPYDFFIMDCLTGNRRGPLNISVEDTTRPTDYILTHGMMASTDPVALDTAEALFCGYDPLSIKILRNAARDGLGTDAPENIRLAGWEDFARHKQWLYEQHGSRNGLAFGSYPFFRGWGGADLLKDFEAPEILECTLLPEGDIAYRVRDRGTRISGLSRIDVLSGEDVIISVKNPEMSGVISLDNTPGTDTEIRLAAWDRALNCRLSPILDNGL